MKIQPTLYVHFIKYSWEEVGEYQIFSVKLEDTEYRTYVSSQEVEIEIPENYDPTAQKILALQKEKEKLQAEFTKSVMDIQDRISKLQCLEYTA